MPQIFHRSFNTISKVTILGGAFIIAGAGWAYDQFVWSDYMTGVGVYRVQPVPFSHQHHVAGLGIDCRYCHTSVEKSPFAGIPPTATCMNCHSQMWTQSPMLELVRASYRTDQSIPWNRVHNLPGFVYFDHSIHLKKGIGCVSCHGRVDQMPLTRQVATLYMAWCLDCHRHPEYHIRPRSQVFSMTWTRETSEVETAVALGKKLMKEYGVQRRTDCSACHR